jgi:hypothetical protein
MKTLDGENKSDQVSIVTVLYASWYGQFSIKTCYFPSILYQDDPGKFKFILIQTSSDDNKWKNWGRTNPTQQNKRPD